MSRVLFSCAGGTIVLPPRQSLLLSRAEGGNLVVNPPRPVWERGELTAGELTNWAYLVAAAGSAMLEVLPQLEGGCINYWEAGNWALNDAAEPAGPKRAPDHRNVHLHLLGRSRTSADPAWRWGESPRFPDYAERLTWAERYQRLTPEECRAVIGATDKLLRERYGMPTEAIEPWTPCPGCGYPQPWPATKQCPECARR